jgi:hypothetical protein
MMRPAIGWILLAVLSGCLSDPGKDGTCGTSAGCGNPTKLAELHPTETTCFATCGGLEAPTPFSVRFGDSLSIKLDSTRFTGIDSVRTRALLYQGFQVPVFSPAPIDSFQMGGNSLVLHPADLARSRAAIPEADTGTFAFSIRIILSIYSKNLVSTQEGLLAGLGLERDSNRFIHSPGEPFRDSSKAHYLQDTISYYQGMIRNWPSLSKDAESAYVYIPGSPYFDVISMTDGRFLISSLPLGGQFELRFFVVPRVLPGNRKVPSYILKSDPDKSPDRIFEIDTLSDFISIPAP